MFALLRHILPPLRLRTSASPSIPLATTSTSLTIPTQTTSPALLFTRGYRTRTALKLRCENCFFCKRRGKLRVECRENPKHKQKQK